MMRLTLRNRCIVAGLSVTAACTGGSTSPVYQGLLTSLSGNNQSAPAGTVLQPYQVKVSDQNGSPISGVYVHWQVTAGGGSVAPDSAVTDAAGISTAIATLGGSVGVQSVTATLSGYSGSPLAFNSQATTGAAFSVLAGGNNVPERYTSDLWVADGYAYTGTWYGPRT
ncbi:MAG: hypothetical protein ABI742_15115, partial [Gemmatimonadota bacterium]